MVHTTAKISQDYMREIENCEICNARWKGKFDQATLDHVLKHMIRAGLVVAK